MVKYKEREELDVDIKHTLKFNNKVLKFNEFKLEVKNQ